MKHKLFLTIVMIISFFTSVDARDIAVKSNLLYDATLTANAGVEIGLAPKWSFDLSGNINAWRLSDGKQWRHWLIQPEARYWLCNRFAGHFFAAHLLGGQYNFGHLDMNFNLLGSDLSKLKDMRYQGWFAGAGIGYGYSWILDKHWNFEAEIGIGWAYTRFDKFRCAGCGQKIDSNLSHNYFGPTKVALNIVYFF